MSQSVSISYGLIFLSTLLISSILLSTVIQRNNLLQEAQEKEDERRLSRLHTDIEIQSVELGVNTSQIHIYLINTGEEMLYQLEKMDVFFTASRRPSSFIFSRASPLTASPSMPS